MKLLPLSFLSCLAFIFTADGQIIKISGKWFNKTSIVSQNGKVTRTTYTPLTQGEILSINNTGVSDSSSKTTQNDNIFTVVNKIVESSVNPARTRRKIKNIKASHNMEMKQAKNDRVHELDLDDIQSEGDDKIQQKTKIDQQPIQDKKSLQIVTKGSQLIEEGKKVTSVNVISHDRLENEKPSLQNIRPSYSQPFTDVESPFLRRESDEEQGNLSTNDTNIIEGKGNLVDGKYNEVTGNRNKIDNGNYNQIRGDRNIVKDGDNNIINGYGSLVVGSRNIIH